MAGIKSKNTIVLESLEVGDSAIVTASMYYPQYLYKNFTGQFSVKNKGGTIKKMKWEVTRISSLD